MGHDGAGARAERISDRAAAPGVRTRRYPGRGPAIGNGCLHDAQNVAAWLLLAGPLLGLIPVGYPSLLSIWSLPRDAFAAVVGAHRAAWTALNAGFVLASATTTAGLLAFVLAVPNGATSAWVLAGTAGYAIGAVLWCVVLAVRSRTAVLMADLDPGALDSPQVRILEEALTRAVPGIRPDHRGFPDGTGGDPGADWGGRGLGGRRGSANRGGHLALARRGCDPCSAASAGAAARLDPDLSTSTGAGVHARRLRRQRRIDQKAG